MRSLYVSLSSKYGRERIIAARPHSRSAKFRARRRRFRVRRADRRRGSRGGVRTFVAMHDLRSLHGGLPGLHRAGRSEEHTSELQSLRHLVCRLLLEKKKKQLDTRYYDNADEGRQLLS